MSLYYRVISIGALGRNRFWNEAKPKRISHATTTLIRDSGTTLLVDPGLPPEVLRQRLDERSGLTPEQIDAVFLTTFRPVHRRSLALFPNASWLMHAPEITAMGRHLDELAGGVDAQMDGNVERLVQEERALLERIETASDKLSKQVHLFPLPGVTPGSAGLLLAMPTRTVIIAGDAVVTQDYFEAGRVFEQAAVVADARESFSEIMEIADEIIPGHDNGFRVAGPQV